MRKYKQVKRKEVAFDLNEWAEVERRAAAANLKIGTYIKKIAVNGELTYYDMQNAAPLVNAMRTINNNVNQIARNVNAIGDWGKHGNFPNYAILEKIAVYFGVTVSELLGKEPTTREELDDASCMNRFAEVYRRLGVDKEPTSNLAIWNLRGRCVPMDKLAPKLIRRAVKQNYSAIIIDPIYKVITGDENSADQMAYFCNQFDTIAAECGCAVIYCHHHSKGVQGNKKSMDRASGSGVFARDPDAMLDMIELPVSEQLRKTEADREACKVCAGWLQRFLGDKYREYVSQDDECSKPRMMSLCNDSMPRNAIELMVKDIEASNQRVGKRTAWRIDGTLREFPRFEPVNVWFDYPVHTAEKNKASLQELIRSVSP